MANTATLFQRANDPHCCGMSSISSISFALQTYIPPIVGGIGLIGNVLTFMVMNLHHNRRSVMCYYFKVLATSDALTLLSGFILRYVFILRPEWLQIYAVGRIFCILFYYFNFLFYNVSIWQVAIIALDRFVVVRYPLRASSWCTSKRAKVLVACNLLFHGIAYFPNLFRTSENVRVPNIGSCMLPEWSKWYEFGQDVINTSLDSVIPVGIICILNVAIIVSLKQHTSILKDKTGLIHSKSDSKKETTMTLMLVVVATTLIILVLPYTVDFLLWSCCMSGYETAHPGSRALSFEISFTFCTLNTSINFFLYSFSSASFRADLLAIFCCRQRQSATSSARSLTSGSTSNYRTTTANR
ncbi:alpha-1A adrenergic receptor-like [Lineus longissimus]|uniref:alpha-1A adrenergic receptor-like n=1 Tax=Lineus longissimus TaxID=88925 RepID=UPI002B4C4494